MATPPRLRFSSLWRRLGAHGSSDSVFDALAAMYDEPARAYHTLGHVLDCLDRLDEAEAPAVERDIVEAAIWFHDCVYDSKRNDNEARSAELAARELSAAGVTHPALSRVPELIRMTDHTAEPVEADGRLLCDIDLSIFGRNVREFDDYDSGIRKEYAWVPESEYREGRLKVLSSFLDRARIYLTDDFNRRFEAAARQNLHRALARLRQLTPG